LNQDPIYDILVLMDIKWLGHSCFQIRSRTATIVTDPFSPDYGYSLGEPTSRIVTMSHGHAGHSYIQGVGGDTKSLRAPGEYEISGVLIVWVSTFHDNEKGAARGKNTVFVMDVDEVSVCHVGDLGHVLSTDHVEAIGNVDVLMVTVGGVSTIDAAAAAEVVRQLEPKVILPMHYKTDVLDRGLAPVEDFLKEMGLKDVVSQPKLTVTRANLPQTPQVFLLDY